MCVMKYSSKPVESICGVVYRHGISLVIGIIKLMRPKTCGQLPSVEIYGWLELCIVEGQLGMGNSL